MKKHWTFSKILRDVFFKTTVCFFNGFGVSKTNVLMVFKWCFNTIKTAETYGHNSTNSPITFSRSLLPLVEKRSSGKP